MLSDFDKNQIALLKTFAKREVVLHFPFFANTFSIAFHYITSLQDIYAEQKSKANENISKCVREHDWDKPIPDLVEESDNIFYATLDAITKKEGYLRSKWKLFDYRPISHYRPRYIFAEYHPHLDPEFKYSHDSRSKTIHNSLIFSDKLVEDANECGVNRIEVFTDIPTQADVIEQELRNWGFQNEIIILREPIDAISYYAPSIKLLRLFYYGAPTTSRMLRDGYRYISYLLPNSELRGENYDPTMITCICYAKLNNYTSVSDTERDELEILVDYHNSIFAKAMDVPRHFDFINIVWAYNRFAERKQHSATFANTKDFAECLRDHHETPIISNR